MDRVCLGDIRVNTLYKGDKDNNNNNNNNNNKEQEDYKYGSYK